jgi:hypothetical protein
MNKMSEEEEIGEFWEFLLKKHWLRLLPFVLIIIGAFISGIYVFLVYNETWGFWTYTIGDFSFGRVVGYLFWLILWEFLLVGLPTLGVLGIIFGIMWFTLSPEKREQFKVMSKREEETEKKHKSHKASGTGGFTGIITLVFLIIMAVNGKWETLFTNIDLHYFVATYLWAMLWVGVVIGIPALIGGIFYLRYKLK